MELNCPACKHKMIADVNISDIAWNYHDRICEEIRSKHDEKRTD